MGILDRLFGGRFTLPPPEETAVSDAAIMRELHPYRSGLKAFAQALLARLPEAERARLVRRVLRIYGSGQEPATALVDEHGIELEEPWPGSVFRRTQRGVRRLLSGRKQQHQRV